MSIAREEAIKHITTWMYVTTDLPPMQVAEALDLAITALRGPTREMVERMRGEWKISEPLIECQVCGEIYSRYGENEGKPFDFCPVCGSPMTDEAVGIMLERWREALGDEVRDVRENI